MTQTMEENDAPDEPSASDERWATLVERGRAVNQRQSTCQWELGDLARDVETNYGENDLGRYADEINIPFNTIKTYRYVASRWAIGTRVPHVSWSVHRSLANLSDRAEVITSRSEWTDSEAKELVTSRKHPRPKPEPKPRPDPRDQWINVGNVERAKRVIDSLADGAQLLDDVYTQLSVEEELSKLQLDAESAPLVAELHSTLAEYRPRIEALLATYDRVGLMLKAMEATVLGEPNVVIPQDLRDVTDDDVSNVIDDDDDDADVEYGEPRDREI